MSKIKILAIYREKLKENRGTPIRVRSLLEHLAKYDDVSLTVASWDKALEFAEHFHLTNDHFDDLKKLYNYIKQNDIDVVIGHTMATYYYLFPLKVFTKSKIVLEMHGFMEEESLIKKGISAFGYARSKIIFSLFYNACDLITTCSETAADILSKYNKNVVVIYGGVDLSLFNPKVESGGYIARVKGDIVIGYAGNARVWQGLDFLLDAYNELRISYPTLKLVLITDKKNKIVGGENVLYIDQVNHALVPSFLKDCDILVIPRMNNEVNRISFPSKLMEYMAMGKPVVASRTSDVHKVVRDGFDGVLYDPGDKQAFQSRIIELMEPLTRKRIGDNAYKTVQCEFTWEKQTKILINNIRKLR